MILAGRVRWVGNDAGPLLHRAVGALGDDEEPMVVSFGHSLVALDPDRRIGGPLPCLCLEASRNGSSRSGLRVDQPGQARDAIALGNLRR